MKRRWPLSGKPYAVQRAALDRSQGKAAYGFWLEQGLGKTAVAYAEFQTALLDGKVDAMVIIAPAYLTGNWEDEARTWGLQHPVRFWPKNHAAAHVRRELEGWVADDRPQVWVFYYEALLSAAGRFLEGLLTRRRHLLVLDESSSIKNPNGKWTKLVLRLRQHAPMVRLLSGTPMTQSVMDWWPQLRCLGELSGMNPYAFRNRFARMGGYMGKQVIGVREGREEELHTLLNRCSFRALKEDWWDDMPEKVYLPQPYAMQGRQLELYRTMEAEFYAEINEAETVFAEQVVTSLIKLQQIARGFIINEGEAVPLVSDDDNPALQAIRQRLDITRGKVIIFAFHEYACRMLFQALRDWQPAVLRGHLKKDELTERKDRFNNDPACRLCIGQLSVAARGHTLLGGNGDDRCSTSIFFEDSYSLEMRTHAEDRNHRFGQDRAVAYVDLVGSSIEKRIADAHKRKQAVVDTIVNAVRARNVA